MSSSSTTNQETFAEYLNRRVSEALGKSVNLKEESSPFGFSGGGGAFTSTAIDQNSDGTKYFVKSATNKIDMLRAEYLGVKEIAETETIRVPTPIAFGEHRSRAFAVFEFLQFCRGNGKSADYEMGQQLARMHRCTSPKGLGFGFHVNNTIGATFQPNLPWRDNWPDFWEEHRLNHMLRLCHNIGFDDKKIDALRTKTRELLSSHHPVPSLVHGDLWGGNAGYCKDNGKVVPVIFDPASY
jgi:fructosamine-3-kinase